MKIENIKSYILPKWKEPVNLNMGHCSLLQLKDSIIIQEKKTDKKIYMNIHCIMIAFAHTQALLILFSSSFRFFLPFLHDVIWSNVLHIKGMRNLLLYYLYTKPKMNHIFRQTVYNKGIKQWRHLRLSTTFQTNG